MRFANAWIAALFWSAVKVTGTVTTAVIGSVSVLNSVRKRLSTCLATKLLGRIRESIPVNLMCKNGMPSASRNALVAIATGSEWRITQRDQRYQKPFSVLV